MIIVFLENTPLMYQPELYIVSKKHYTLNID